MFAICIGAFLVLLWTSSWMSGRAVNQMVRDIDASRPGQPSVEGFGWHYFKRQKIWSLHHLLGLDRRVRQQLIYADLIGVAGIFIALFGMFGSLK
jgi:hypothetical protein